MKNLNLCLAITFLSGLLLIGCSSSRQLNPVDPLLQDQAADLPVTSTDEISSNHALAGIWDVEIDVNNLNADVNPVRDLGLHYNVSLLIPGPQIDIISFDGVTGIIEVDVTVGNPSTIDGYDVRFIVFTDAAGHMLKNADDWTDLYDQPGGLPINPFKAYAKDQPNRLFAHQSQYTERLEVFLPAGNPNVRFAIDACFPGNCLDPYSIDNFSMERPLKSESGDYVATQVTVLDWQGNVSAVYLYCPVVTGQAYYPFVKDAVNPELWTAPLENATGAAPGDYTGFIAAYDQVYGHPLYDKVIVSVAKAPPSYMWTSAWGSSDYDYPEAIAVDNSYNAYIGGYFDGDADFDPSIGEYILHSNGDDDAFLMKLSMNGHLMWAVNWGGTSSETVWGLAVDSVGNVYAAGNFYNTVDFDPGLAVVEVNSNQNSSDCFLSKFDSNGNFQWVKTWGGDQTDRAFNVKTDSFNNLFITGTFISTVDFDPGSGVEERISVAASQDMFLLKLDSGGNFQWVNTWGGSSGDTPRGLAVKSDQIFVSGDFQGICDFDPEAGEYNLTAHGNRDAFASKFNTDGAWNWADGWGGDSDTWTREIAVDSSGNIYIPGSFGITCDFDPGDGEDIRIANDAYDIYLLKLDNDGDYQWAVTIGGFMNDLGYAVALDSDGNALLAGSFRGSVDFDPGSGTDTRSANYIDIFIAGYDKNGGYLWAYTYPSASSQTMYKILSKDSYIYGLGYFNGTVDFNPGPGEDIKIAEFDYNIFLSRFSTD